jgi:hypothetical protein
MVLKTYYVFIITESIIEPEADMGLYKKASLMIDTERNNHSSKTDLNPNIFGG